MWIVFSILSAFFAGITSILAKIGIKNTNSNVATALRTIVVLFFSWIMVCIVGSQGTIPTIDFKTWIFLVLSGLATGASWLCYFKALQMGDINKVVPIDKSSTILTILLAFLLLHEEITMGKFIGVALIGLGTFLMIQKSQNKANKDDKNKLWIMYAIFSAIFASLTAIFGKIGIDGVESNLGTAIRTSVVLLMAWALVLFTKQQHTIKEISRKELLFIGLSGIATGVSWLCYYKALQDGLTSVVVSIDKLSILVTILFSIVVFKEKLSLKSFIGLTLMVIGTFCMLLF
ncbi:MAG: EamA family transporter [Bacilli bacterium]